MRFLLFTMVVVVCLGCQSSDDQAINESVNDLRSVNQKMQDANIESLTAEDKKKIDTLAKDGEKIIGTLPR